MSGASPLVPVSWGELLDKLTILEIKKARIDTPEARANVEREWTLLSAIAGRVTAAPGVEPLLAELRQVNEALWKIEDAIRDREAEQDFGADFVALARSVYRENDRRAAVKRRINLLLKSELVEEKSYSAGGRSAHEAAA